jgi:hypothetical protein
MTEHRWSKFWWQDYESDDALRLCSLAAQGLWMRMLCAMHRATPYGHLLVNGAIPNGRQMSIMLCATEREIAKLVPELEQAGVLSRNDAGAIYSRRMVRDKAMSEEGAANGRRGGNPALRQNAQGGLTPPLNPKQAAPLKLEAEAEAEERKKEKDTSLPDPSAADAERAEPAAEPSWPPPPLPSAVTSVVGQLTARLEGRTRDKAVAVPAKPARSVAEQLAAVSPGVLRLRPADPTQLAEARASLARKAGAAR